MKHSIGWSNDQILWSGWSCEVVLEFLDIAFDEQDGRPGVFRAHKSTHCLWYCARCMLVIAGTSNACEAMLGRRKGYNREKVFVEACADVSLTLAEASCVTAA